MSTVRTLPALAVAAISALVLAAASAWSIPTRDAGAARLRLTWTARPERIEVCRRLSDEELAALAEHMRQRIQCEGAAASYALGIAVDGVPHTASVVRGGGLRHDRPIHLLEEFDLPAGEHRIAVHFTRREAATADTATSVATPPRSPGDTGLFAGRAEREVDERRRRLGAAIPPRLTLDTLLRLAPGSVVVVTVDADQQRLVLHARPDAD